MESCYGRHQTHLILPTHFFVIIKLYKQMERDINDKTNYTEKLAEDTDFE